MTVAIFQEAPLEITDLGTECRKCGTKCVWVQELPLTVYDVGGVAAQWLELLPPKILCVMALSIPKSSFTPTHYSPVMYWYTITEWKPNV